MARKCFILTLSVYHDNFLTGRSKASWEKSVLFPTNIYFKVLKHIKFEGLTWTSAQCLCASLDWRRAWGRMNTCICMTESPCCSPILAAMVNQLYPNTKLKVKKKRSPEGWGREHLLSGCRVSISLFSFIYSQLPELAFNRPAKHLPLATGKGRPRSHPAHWVFRLLLRTLGIFHLPCRRVVLNLLGGTKEGTLPQPHWRSGRVISSPQIHQPISDRSH